MKNMALDNSSELVKFGLSSQEAVVYQTLIKEGAQEIRHLAKEIGVLPNALYRVTSKLIAKGLVTSSQEHPAIYKAISPSIAFDAFVKNQVVEMETRKENLINSLTSVKTPDQTRIDLIKNTREFFLSYADMAQEAKKEILIISIGEEVPEEVLLANRDALERKVKIRFIAHKYDHSNKDLLIRWVRMGIDVKHSPDWGFHLVVVDKKKSIMSVNNPKATNERLSMKIYSEGLSKAFSDYFDSIWVKATKI